MIMVGNKEWLRSKDLETNERELQKNERLKNQSGVMVLFTGLEEYFHQAGRHGEILMLMAQVRYGRSR